MRLVSYARVSLVDGSQTTENQTHALEAWIASHPEAEVVERLTEEASTRKRRPVHDRALELLRSGEADTLLIWGLDRWGRSSAELILELDEAVRKNWRIVSLKEDIDLSTAAGRMFAQVLAIIANYERSRISERTREGLARVKLTGSKSGRPIGRPRKTPPAENPLRDEGGSAFVNPPPQMEALSAV